MAQRVSRVLYWIIRRPNIRRTEFYWHITSRHLFNDALFQHHYCDYSSNFSHLIQCRALTIPTTLPGKHPIPLSPPVQQDVFLVKQTSQRLSDCHIQWLFLLDVRLLQSPPVWALRLEGAYLQYCLLLLPGETDTDTSHPTLSIRRVLYVLYVVRCLSNFALCVCSEGIGIEPAGRPAPPTS